MRGPSKTDGYSATAAFDVSQRLVEALVENPVTPAQARQPVADGGVPDGPGLYAWWLTDRTALDAVPAPPHPALPGLWLLYVGIVPRNSMSGETLRSRVLGKHLGSSLAGSTFRRSLAALLWEQNDWTPRLTPAERFKLSTVDDDELRQWQGRTLRVSWTSHTAPWLVEGPVIASLTPPLNLRDNHSHPFYDTMAAARERFKARAEALERD